MAMTKNEKILKSWLIKTLRGQGYKTYSEILKELDLRIDNRPDVAAYMSPQTGEIALGAHVIGANKEEFAKIASVLVRHEILHGFLQHEQRLLNKLEKMHRDANDGVLDNVNSDTALKDLLRKDLYTNPEYQYGGATYANYAGDYEISNRGYTQKDKDIIRNINLNGTIVSGLVTEDKHPDWVNLSVEELFDKVKEEFDKQKAEAQNSDQNSSDVVLGAFEDDTTFHGADGVVYGV